MTPVEAMLWLCVCAVGALALVVCTACVFGVFLMGLYVREVTKTAKTDAEAQAHGAAVKLLPPMNGVRTRYSRDPDYREE